MQVCKLRPSEAVQLDMRRLEEICLHFGCIGGEAAICAAMEDLAVLLERAQALWRAADFGELGLCARQISGIADRIGLAKLARVAGTVEALAGTRDDAALAANVSRLARLGERSLVAIWDVQDLSV